MSRFPLRIGFCLAVAAISLIVLGLPHFAPVVNAAEPQVNAQALARAMQIQDRHTGRLMGIPGVVGTATGLDAAGQPVVKVFLAKGGVPGIAAKLEGVSVDVEVTGVFVALRKPSGKPSKPPAIDPTARFPRPVPIGVSTGHPNITAGTIGCRVFDEYGEVYALSNNHVYADENRALTGNVLQPGPWDGGIDPADAIGTLWDFYLITFKGPYPPYYNNTIDAAIAWSSTDLLGKATPSNGYGTPKSSPVRAKVRLSVKKYGRTTGQTQGRVYAVNAKVDVGYDSGVARFVNQIIVTPGSFSAGGDSGSLVVTADGNNPVGLLFAGSPTMTVCNPIDAVLEFFGVWIDGQ